MAGGRGNWCYQEEKSIRFTFKDFLHNANLRFLDDLSNRRQRETSFGDSTLPEPADRTLADKLRAEISAKTTLREVDLGCEGLEKATVSTQERAQDSEKKLEKERPYVFARLDGPQHLAKDELSELQMELRRLKNFCRLLARRQWYEWRAGFEASISQKLAAQNKILSADLSVLQDATETLKRTCAAADSDAAFWNLKPLPEKMQEPLSDTLLEKAKSHRAERTKLATRLAELRERRTKLLQRNEEVENELKQLKSQKMSLSGFAASVEHMEKTLSQSSHRNDLLCECTGVIPTMITKSNVTLDLSGLIEVSIDLGDPEYKINTIKVSPKSTDNGNVQTRKNTSD